MGVPDKAIFSIKEFWELGRPPAPQIGKNSQIKKLFSYSAAVLFGPESKCTTLYIVLLQPYHGSVQVPPAQRPFRLHLKFTGGWIFLLLLLIFIKVEPTMYTVLHRSLQCIRARSDIQVCARYQNLNLVCLFELLDLSVEWKNHKINYRT